MCASRDASGCVRGNAVHIDFSGKDPKGTVGGSIPVSPLGEYGTPRNKASGYYPAFETRTPPAPQKKSNDRLASFVGVLGETLLPTAVLIGLLLFTFILAQKPFTELDAFTDGLGLSTQDGRWVNWAVVFIPTSFFAIQLTSRRYGSEIAFLQIVSAWTFVVLAMLFLPELYGAGTFPLRHTISLAIALLVAHNAAAIVFDGARCIRWWQAPLLSGLWASFAFAILFYPLALIGSAQNWFDPLLVHLGILLAESSLLLIPYWMLRPLIRPRAGYSGY